MYIYFYLYIMNKYFYKDIDITTYIGYSQDVNNFTQSAIARQSGQSSNPSQFYQGIDPLYLAGSNSNIEKLYSNTSLLTYSANSTQLTNMCIPPFADYVGTTQVSKPSWATHCSIICVGGGGGGAGGTQGFQKSSNQDKNSQMGAGGGGGGGGGISYLINTSLQGTNSLTLTVGGGGTAGNMDQVGGAGQVSKVQWSSYQVSANGGQGGSLGSSNGGGGGAGGAGGTYGQSTYTGYTIGQTGSTGGYTTQTSRVPGGSVTNSIQYIPSLTVYGRGGDGGGSGNDDGSNPTTPGLAGTQGIIRIYWLNSNFN
jgi:hypothetical protein